MLYEIIAKKLQGVAAFCSAARIHKETFYDWVKHHPEFKEAYLIAREDAESAWWNHPDTRSYGYVFWQLCRTQRFGRDMSKKRLSEMIKSSKTFKEKTDAIWDSYGSGEINVEESVRLNNILIEQYKTQEIVEMRKDIEELKQTRAEGN